MLNGVRLWKGRVQGIRRAVQQRRTSAVGLAHLRTVIERQRCDLSEPLGFNLVRKALDDGANGFLDGALPCPAQPFLQGIHRSFPLVVATALVEALFVIELLLHAADDLFDRLCAGGRILLDKSRMIDIPGHAAEGRMRALRTACLVEKEEEGDIVGKDNDLPLSPFRGKPVGHCLAVQMVKR